MHNLHGLLTILPYGRVNKPSRPETMFSLILYIHGRLAAESGGRANAAYDMAAIEISL